jgi:glucose/mannose-6-phosphate isomerase
MMDQLIEGFSDQVREALKIGSESNISAAENEIRNIVVSGLGGSGIGGQMVAELLETDLKIPMTVSRGYFLPSFVDKHTLVIISSYSGNTEETLNAFEEAMQKNAKIVCVTSNGKVLQTAKENKLDFVQIPGGNPPRASLGYSFVQQLFILNKLGLTTDSLIRALPAAMDLIDELKTQIQTEAKTIAEKIEGSLPILYVCRGMESVAVRFRQQLNENAKILCWHHVIPEMNHNELVGWRTKNDDFAVIYLRNEDDYARNQQRIELNKQIIGEYTSNIIEIWSKGKNKTERFMYLVHLTDWVSFYLAQLRNMDAVEVKVIDFLKASLAGK